MASKNKYIASIVLDGEREFKSAVTACNQKLATMRSEMKLNKEEFSGAENTISALNSKYSLLEKTMQLQAQKIKAIKDGMNHASQEYNRVIVNLSKLRAEYDQACKALDKMKNSSDATEEELKKQEEEVEKLASAISIGEQSYQRAGRNVEEWQKKLYTAQAQEKKTGRELANYKKYIDEAKKSVDGCAISIDRYGKKSKEAEVAVKEGVNALAGVISSSGMAAFAREIADVLFDCSKAADDFSVSVAKLSTIADTSEVSMGSLKKELMELSGETGEAVDGLTETAYQAISAGTSTAKSVEVTATATKAAVGGFTDAETALNGLTTIVNSYGDKVKDATQVSDVFLTVQNLGKTSFGELGSNIGKVATNAANYNMSLEDLGTSYVELTKRGIQTAEATTYTNSLLKELAKSSSTLSGILRNKTGKSFDELMGEGNSLGDVLGIIYDSVGKNNTAFTNLFSSQEAATAAVTLLKGGTEGYNKTLQEVKNSVGATDKAYEKMTNTSAYAKKKLTNDINNIKIAVGEQLNKELAGLLAIGADITSWVDDVVEKHPEVVRVITALVASLGTLSAILAGYTIATRLVIPLIYEFNTALASNPIGLVAVALSSLVAGLAAFNVMQHSALEETNKEIEAMEASRKEIEEKDNAIKKSIETTKEKVKNTQDEIAITETLISKLLTLNSVENKSAGQKAEIKGIVDNLKESMPELADAYNETTGSVELTRKEILKLAAAYKKQAVAQGMQKQIQEATEAATQAEINHEKAMEKSAEALKKRQKAAVAARTAEERWKAEQRKNEKNPGINRTEEMTRYAGEYEEKKKKLNDLIAEEKKLKDAENSTKKTMDEANKSVDTAVNFCEKYMKKTSENAQSEKKNASNVKKTASEYNKLSSAYGKAVKSRADIGEKENKVLRKTFQSTLKIAKKIGTEIPAGLAKDLKTGAKKPESATKELCTAVNNNLLGMAEEARSIGIHIPQEITDAIMDGSMAPAKAYGFINKEIKKEGKRQQGEMEKIYLKTPKTMKKAFEKGGEAGISAIRKSKTTIKELQKDAGVSSTDGLIKGVQEGIPRVEEAYRNLAKKANAAFKNTLDIHSPSRVFSANGEYTVLGVMKGVDALKGKLEKKYAELGLASDAAYREAMEIHSPSKKMEKNGKHTIDGLVKGMQLNLGNVEKTAKKSSDKVNSKVEAERKKAAKRQAEIEKKAQRQQNAIVKKAENKISTKNLNEKEVVQLWEKVKKATKKGTDAHIKALKKYKAAKEKLLNEEKKLKKEFKKNYEDMMKDLQSSISDYKSQIGELQKTYKESVASTQSSIGGSWGMFSKASVSKTNNAAGLIRNMKTQADTVTQYQKNMDKLRKSGLSSEIIKELESAGISSAGDVATLAAMNKKQLEEYQRYYNIRESYAKQEALAVNSELKKSTEDQITELNKKMVSLEKTYAKKIDNLEKKYKKQMKKLGENVGNGFANGIEKGSKNVYKAIAKMTGQTVKQVKKNLGIHSPSRVFDDLGGNTGLGFAQGLDRETKNLSDILLGNLPKRVPSPAISDSDAQNQWNGNGTAQLNLYMDSNIVASATFKKIDLMQGANIRLLERGLAI